MEILYRITEWLNHNPWLNLVFLVLAILSIVISVVLFIKSRKEKSPYFSIRTFQLVEDKLNKIQNVEILYQGNKVDNLSLSKVALWNRGKETINTNDIAPKDPLRLAVAPNCKLLSADLIYATTEANNFSVTSDLEKGEILINFDYFHTNEGLVIEFYHTGKSNDDITLKGTIKGVSKIINLIPDKDYLTDSFLERLVSILQLRRIKPRPLRIAVGILVGIATMPIGISLMFVDWLMKPMRRVPRQFKLD